MQRMLEIRARQTRGSLGAVSGAPLTGTTDTLYPVKYRIASTILVFLGIDYMLSV